MNSDPWIRILEQLEPKYQDLKYMSEHAPKIRVVLRKVNMAWRIRIEEDWTHVDEAEQYMYYTAVHGNFDGRCEWATEQLKDWKFVNRLSYQEWKFKRRADAEKFLTIFNLKWSCQ